MGFLHVYFVSFSVSFDFSGYFFHLDIILLWQRYFATGRWLKNYTQMGILYKVLSCSPQIEN